MDIVKDFKNPFKQDNSFYKQRLNPKLDYYLQAAVLKAKKLNITYEESFALIQQEIKDDPIVNNRRVKYYERDDKTLDRSIKVSNIRSYLKDVVVKDQILVPSFTTYVKTTVEQSVYSGFTANIWLLLEYPPITTSRSGSSSRLPIAGVPIKYLLAL